MALTAKWTGNPNSAHQIWSRWTFTAVSPIGINLPIVRDNAARWAKKGFGTAGRMKVEARACPGFFIYTVTVEVEGAPAMDPGYVRSVQIAWADFARKGWGSTVQAATRVQILAGETGLGTPPSQLVVMPTIEKGEGD